MTTNTTTGSKENPLVSFKATDDTGLNYSAIYQDGQEVFFTGPDCPMYATLQTTTLPVVAYSPLEPEPEPSTEQKVDNMLSAFGLTRDELRAALAVEADAV